MRYWRSHMWDVHKYVKSNQSDKVNKKKAQPYGAGLNLMGLIMRSVLSELILYSKYLFENR